jgi:outer membrane protein
MKQRGLWLVLVGALVASGSAFADDNGGGDWMVRVRAVRADLKDGGTTVGEVGVSNKWIPEVDVSYFFTQNIAAELILTYPQKHDVTLDGATIGTIKELPPTLLAQYHFMPGGSVDPYIGAGINYTRFSNANILGGVVSTSSNSIGPALQVGVDVPITGNMSFNVDVKKVWMKTDVYLNAPGGGKVGTVDLNPWLFGVGLGWKF